jgi:hypothetical protein
MSDAAGPNIPRERRTLTELRNRLSSAERQYVAESARYIQTGPRIPSEAHARLQAAKRRVEAARRALDDSSEHNGERRSEIARFLPQSETSTPQ